MFVRQEDDDVLMASGPSLVETNLVVYQHIFPRLSAFLAQEHLPGRRYMRQLSTWYRWQAGA